MVFPSHPDYTASFLNQGAESIGSVNESTPSSGAKHFNDIAAKILQPSLTSQFVVSITEPGNGTIKSREKWSQAKKDAGLNYNTGAQETLYLLCSETVLPGSSLATHTITSDFTGVTEQHAYRRVYDNKIDFTFMVPAGENAYIPIRFFETWMKYIANEPYNDDLEKPNHSYRMKYPAEYYAQGVAVEKFEKDGLGTNLVYKFVNCFPTSIVSMPVTYDASQILKCTVSMSYIRYYINSVQGKREPAAEVVEAEKQDKRPPVTSPPPIPPTHKWFTATGMQIQRGQLGQRLRTAMRQQGISPNTTRVQYQKLPNNQIKIRK
jgi:hypothetical protein